MKNPLRFACVLILAGSAWVTFADVSVPTLFSDHMVLQRNKPVVIWGWADAGESIKISLADQSASTKADKQGKWMIRLDPMKVGGPYRMTIAGKNTLNIQDIMVGEVWIASGQSNMFFTVNRATNADLKVLTANRRPQIRFNNVRNDGSQEPQRQTTGPWIEISPETISNVSAVAYSFAETLHDTLGVTIGVIENSWGGSAAEAWTPRDVIKNDPQLRNIHEEWLEIEKDYDFEKLMAAYEQRLEEWQEEAVAARARGESPPRRPRQPSNRMTGQHRPSNLWNARVLPIAPYSVRGAIWYQGESNAHGIEEALQYEHLFSTMITEWRKLWNDSFPFYFVQLADFREESLFAADEPWPYLRHSQTQVVQNLPATGQAVITDIGEGKDIHPKEKEDVGRRLARWALNRNYGFSGLACRSPEIASWNQEDSAVVVDFDYTGSGFRPFDTNQVKGFAVKDADGTWHVVDGEVMDENSVELKIPDGIMVTAVAYAWANNPICNLFTNDGLPVTPFRTDIE